MSDSEFNLIKFEGKPLEKLIDTISSGIGVLYNPRRIRIEGQAEADRLVMMAEAESKVLLIADDAQNELAKRAAQRFAHQLMQQQLNLENISDQAVQHLDETVSEQPVSDDWKARFFSKAQDVSDKDLQELWAKLLAKEVNSPGQISIRALDILSNMTYEEALVFEKIGGFTVQRGVLPGFRSAFTIDEEEEFYSYEELLLMQELQLINPSKSLVEAISFTEDQDPGVVFLDMVSTLAGTPEQFDVEGYPFSKAGKELLKALDIKSNMNFVNKIEARLRERGFIITN